MRCGCAAIITCWRYRETAGLSNSRHIANSSTEPTVSSPNWRNSLGRTGYAFYLRSAAPSPALEPTSSEVGSVFCSRIKVCDQHFAIPFTGLGLRRIRQLHPFHVPDTKQLSDLRMIIERQDESALDSMEPPFQPSEVLVGEIEFVELAL